MAAVVADLEKAIKVMQHDMMVLKAGKDKTMVSFASLAFETPEDGMAHMRLNLGGLQFEFSVDICTVSYCVMKETDGELNLVKQMVENKKLDLKLQAKAIGLAAFGFPTPESFTAA